MIFLKAALFQNMWTFLDTVVNYWPWHFKGSEYIYYYQLPAPTTVA